MNTGFTALIERCRDDPLIARYDTTEDVGGCWTTAHRTAWISTQLGVPYTFRCWQNPPDERTAERHLIETHGLIINWTYRQIDATAAFPHIEPVSAYQARQPLPICGICGSSHATERCTGITENPFEAPEAAALIREIQARIATMPAATVTRYLDTLAAHGV